MSRLEFAAEVMQDFERFIDHMTQFDVTDAPKRIRDLIHSLQVLIHSPLIGRPVRGHKRELVIGRGARGYVALYRFVAEVDTVFVLAIKSQREAGYKHGGE